MYNEKLLNELMEKTAFPPESRQTFIDADRLIFGNPEYAEQMKSLVDGFNDDTDTNELLATLTELSEKVGIHEYTMHLIFFMYLTEKLHDIYRANSMPEEIFWKTVTDLRAKLCECYDVYGVWGSFVASWFPGFFKFTRYALGRMQFERTNFNRDDYTAGGYTVHEGDTVYNMHIPSLGPLKQELVIDSFKRAYDFFSQELNGKPLVIVCSSWLLFREHYKFLPENSNILRFMDCFDIIESSESDTFNNCWRVYGKYKDEPVENLPEDTGLRRAYKKWMLDGNKTGSGFGIIIFDGNKIINK